MKQRLGAPADPPAVIVGSDDDAVNLQGVLPARRCWPDCEAFVRCQHHSVFVEKLAERHRVVVLGVDDMLTLALCNAHEVWFAAQR